MECLCCSFPWFVPEWLRDFHSTFHPDCKSQVENKILKQRIAVVVVVFYAKRIFSLIEKRETDIEQKQRQDHPVVDDGVVFFVCWFLFRNSYSTLRVPNL